MEQTQSDYNENLGRIYAEASEWLRMANNIVWSAGNLFIPLSLAPFAAIATADKINNRYVCILAGISIFLIFTWIGITLVYKRSTTKAREVLCQIENTWGLSEKREVRNEILNKRTCRSLVNKKSKNNKVEKINYNVRQKDSLLGGWLIVILQSVFLGILIIFWIIVITLPK